MTVRALGYVRVSTAREDMISPELQASAIRDHCARHGYDLVEIHADLDQSGRSFARAEVQRVVERVEAREADVVVVWKVSRFGRTRRDWYVHADRLEVAGGRLESATEGYDAQTSVGKFTRGMLVELAAFESDRIGDVWREVQARRVKDGLTHNGAPRPGYRYDREQGLHVPDPEFAPVLVDMYRRYVAGESFYALVADLNSRGHRTTSGGLWSSRALRRALDSGFAAGYVRYNGDMFGGRHEAVVDADLWAAYLDARGERRRTVAPRSHRSPYLLSGLIYCGRCDGRMHGGEFGKARSPKYRCSTAASTSRAGCASGYVGVRHVHDEVLRHLAEWADDLDAAATTAAAAQQRKTTHTADADRLAREVTRLEGALVRLAQQHAEDEDSDEQVYRAARDDYRARIAAAREQHADALRAARRLDTAPAAIARPLLAEWHTLAVEARRELLRQLVARVVVTTHGRGTPADVAVVPLWESA